MTGHTMVVGASRGLGRGIARAFADAGDRVIAVARTAPALAELAAASPNIRTEVADAADAAAAWSLLDQYRPEVLVLVAGASPVMGPFQHQTWEMFSSTGTPTSRSRSAGCARRCSSRCRPAAGWW